MVALEPPPITAERSDLKREQSPITADQYALNADRCPINAEHPTVSHAGV